MASTSLSLGEYWTRYIRARVESGQFESASAVVRHALRLAKERDAKLDALRSALESADRSPALPLDIDDVFNEAVAQHAQKAG